MSEVVNILGDNLSKIIQKPEVACRGLIRMAFKDIGLEDKLDNNQIGLNDAIRALNEGLLRRLEQIKVNNPKDTTEELKQIINKYQSIFSMSK